MTAEEFRKACGLWASGVSIVTTRDVDGKPYGLTMNAVTSLSLDPPLFLVCVDNKSDTLGAIKRSGLFCVNVLQQDQQALSNAFAKKNPDKFADVSFEWGKTGAPLLGGRLMAIECTVTAVHEGGDHHVFIGEVQEITTPDGSEGVPLIYFRGRYAALSA